MRAPHTALFALIASLAAPAQVEWAEQLPATSPLARDTHGMAFDAGSGSLVLFGGFNRQSSTQLSDTWLWDGQDWQPASPTRSPLARETFGMCADGFGRVLLFGGLSFSGGYRSDTWVYTQGEWTELNPTNRPSPRRWHSMSQAGPSTVLLFGGRDSSGTTLGDTWLFDGTDWIQQSPAISPAPRVNAMTAYDSRRGVVVLFGGGATPETWEWDGSQWFLRNPLHTPPNRGSAGMAYDAVRDRVVVFGGATPGAIDVNDVWEWDGVDWVERFPSQAPDIRHAFRIAYDPVRQATVLFGGRDPSFTTSLGDTWEYTATEVASYEPFGSGCPGSAGIPNLANTFGLRPWIGDTLSLQLTGIPSGGSPVLFLGLATEDPALALDPLGLVGCEAFIQPLVAQPLVNQGGVAFLEAGIPNDPELAGVVMYAQCAVSDQGVNPANLTVSNAGKIVFGVK